VYYDEILDLFQPGMVVRWKYGTGFRKASVIEASQDRLRVTTKGGRNGYQWIYVSCVVSIED